MIGREPGRDALRRLERFDLETLPGQRIDALLQLAAAFVGGDQLAVAGQLVGRQHPVSRSREVLEAEVHVERGGRAFLLAAPETDHGRDVRLERTLVLREAHVPVDAEMFRRPQHEAFVLARESGLQIVEQILHRPFGERHELVLVLLEPRAVLPGGELLEEADLTSIESGKSHQRADLHIPSLDQPSLPTQWWQ
jgi:hypothetical protein